MHHYQIFGLHFASELALAGAEHHLENSLEVEVHIRLGAVPGSSAVPFLVQAHGAIVTAPGVARFRVAGGREILVDPAPGAAPEAVLAVLLSRVLAVLLFQRSLFPLQGSAVETPEGALVFVGPSGAGKSTLADHFRGRGYRVLSDEICVVTEDGRGRFVVLPAVPQLRLRPEAHGELAPAGDQAIHALGRAFCPLPTPLRAVCFLLAQDQAPLGLKTVMGFNRIGWLMDQVCQPDLVEELEVGPALVRMAGRMARSATLLEVCRPWALDRIEATVDLVELALAGGKLRRKQSWA